MTQRACLFPAVGVVACTDETPDAYLCEPCARRRLLARSGGLQGAREDAFIAGYAQGWADARARAGASYGDLEALAEYLRVHG